MIPQQRSLETARLSIRRADRIYSWPLLLQGNASAKALDIHLAGKDHARMRLYIFKSEKTTDLRAFAGEPNGAKLPPNHGPWTVTGVVGVGKAPPHNFSRTAIEEAIDGKGFQLWRLVKKEEEVQA
jgi:hypothetical protein